MRRYTKARECLCTAQRTKESWCVGSGGHWTVRDEVRDRYYDGERSNLLRDRLCVACAALCVACAAGGRGTSLCVACAAGGRGTSCPRCESGTVQLRSGDVVAFSGTKAGRCRLTASKSVSKAVLISARDAMI